MSFNTIRLGSPRKRGEGLRIGAVRYLPRGVPKHAYAENDLFDVWLPVLAPSREFLQAFRERDPNDEAVVQKFLDGYQREMDSTGPRQTIALLGHLSLTTSFSVGCYCEDSAKCHRTVLGRLLESAARSARIGAEHWWNECVYTIAHRDRLREWFDDGHGELRERSRWVGGRTMLHDASEEERPVMLLFADSTDCRRMTHFARIQSIDVDDDETHVKFDRVRILSRVRRPQSLVKLDGDRIAPGYIRPYVLCQLPSFL